MTDASQGGITPPQQERVPMGDRASRLLDKLEKGFPEAWKPEEGDPPLVGTFVRLEEGRTSFGPASIVVLGTDPGVEVAVWLLHTALRSQFKRLRPATGELVAIKYLGKRVPESGGPAYDDYRVAVDRPDGAVPDWDRVGEGGMPATAAGMTTASAPVQEYEHTDDDIPF